MLDKQIIEQVRGIFSALEGQYTLLLTFNKAFEELDSMRSFLSDFASSSEKISVEEQETTENTLYFLMDTSLHLFFLQFLTQTERERIFLMPIYANVWLHLMAKYIFKPMCL